MIGRGVTIQGGGRIGVGCTIGDGCTLKWGATLTRGTVLGQRVFLGPFAVCLGPDFEGGAYETPTRIGNNVRVGAHASIAYGVTVCDNVCIGAHTFVRESIYRPGTYVGVPARRIK